MVSEIQHNRIYDLQASETLLGITPRNDQHNYNSKSQIYTPVVWTLDELSTTDFIIHMELIGPGANGANRWFIPQCMTALLKIEELSLSESTVWDFSYKPTILASYQQVFIQDGTGIDVLNFKIRNGILKSRPKSRWLISVVNACLIGSDGFGQRGTQFIQSISGFNNGNIVLDNDAIASGLYDTYANIIRNDISIGCYSRNDVSAVFNETWNGNGVSQFISDEIPTQEFQFRVSVSYEGNLSNIITVKNSSITIQIQEFI